MVAISHRATILDNAALEFEQSFKMEKSIQKEKIRGRIKEPL